MRWNLFGNCIGDSGYAVHARNLGQALIKEGVDLGIEGSGIHIGNELGNPQPIVDASKKNYQFEKTIMIALADFWGVKRADRLKARIGFGVWEGDRIPYNWQIKINEDHDLSEIWVPSHHTGDAFLNSGVEKPIAIIPHGVNPDIFNLESKVQKDQRFTFLFLGGWKDGEKDRKGLDIAMRAFCAEFKKDEKVKFVVKLNMAYQDAQTVVRNIQALNLPPQSERAEVIVHFQNFPEKELPNFYHAADVFVMPTKADAFCMPIAESMAAGCYPIATKYGGQEDYMKDGFGEFIDGSLIPATGGIMYEDTKWMQPDQKQLQDKMRKCFDLGREKIEKLGADCSARILAGWTWKHSALKAIERMKAYEA